MDAGDARRRERIGAHAVTSAAKSSQHDGMALWQRRAAARRYRTRVSSGGKGNGVAEPAALVSLGNTRTDHRVLRRKNVGPLRLRSPPLLVRSARAIAHAR